MVEGAQGGSGARTEGDHDLLVGHGRAVAAGEHAGDRGLAPVVDDDLAPGRQFDGALQPLGVGQQADLDEHAVEVDPVVLAADPVLVEEAGHPVPVADDLRGQRAGDHVDVRQAAQLPLQHLVGPQRGVELDERDVGDDAGQVDGGLDPGVAAADDGHGLALEEGPVAVGAVGDALVAVLVLAGDAHLAPAGAGGQHHGAGLQGGAALQLHGRQATLLVGGHQALGPLPVHHVDLIVLHVLFQRGGQLRALGVGHRDEVLDRHGVEDLTAEALGGQPGADALAGGVDGGGGPGRAAADHEHVVGVLAVDALGLPGRGADIELPDDLLQGHASLVEHLAVHQDRGHGQHLPGLHLLGEDGPVDGDVGDAGVEHGHQVESLHHVGAVLARQREVGLEVQVPVKGLDLGDDLGIGLRWTTADLQQGQDQRRELVAQGDPGEAHRHVGADPGDGEGRPPLVVVGPHHGDGVGQRGDLVQQPGQLGGLGAVVEAGHERNRVLDGGQVGLELSGQGGVEHGGHRDSGGEGGTGEAAGRRAGRGSAPRPVDGVSISGSGTSRPTGQAVRSCRPGPGTGPGCPRPPPSWRGRPRWGGRPRTGRPSPCAPAPRRCGRWGRR